MFEIGQVINNTYELQERIGAGGGGVIFKAYHRRMRKDVAIKLIKDNAKKMLKDRTEVDLLKDLKHPYLPQVFDFFENNNDVYTVMEFINGQNFKQIISGGRQFEEKSVKKYAVQLCEAVQYLHDHTPPIIHSDIKPSNLMLTPEDNICLIDFNISTITAENGEAYSIGGSKGFAAPEQFKRVIELPLEIDEFHEETKFISNDDEYDETEIMTEFADRPSNPTSVASTASTKNISRAYIDVRTDVYGIGASLYYILTGRVPQNGKTDFRGTNVSFAFRNIISKAMNPISEKRYRNVSEMLAAIKKIPDRKTVAVTAAATAAAAVIIAVCAAIAINSDSKEVSLPASETYSESITASETTSETLITTAAESESVAATVPMPTEPMVTSDQVHINGLTYDIQTTQESEVYGAKVTDEYNATAVSIMKQTYNYFASLDYEERSQYLASSHAVNLQLKEMDPDYIIKNPSSYMFVEDLISTDSDYEIFRYVAKYYNNYTGIENLKCLIGIAKGKISYVCVWDDPDYSIYNVYFKDETEEIINSKNNGSIGFASTVSVMDELGGTDYMLDIEYINIGWDISYDDLPELTKYKNLRIIGMLSIDNINISDFPVMTSIEEIQFGYCNITNFDIVADKFPNLKRIDISGTNISDISVLSQLDKLESLNCRHCKEITDWSVIAKLKNLKTIDISGTNISDISAFSQLDKLESLNIRLTSVSSIADIAGNDKIEELDISNLTFNDSSFMDDLLTLKNLRSLNLQYVKYKNGNTTEYTININGFENFTKLEELTLSRAKDLSPLAGLTEMRSLELFSIETQDYSPIRNMTKLEKLNIYGCKGINASIFKNLVNLKELTISMGSELFGESKYGYIDKAELFENILKMRSLEKLDLSYIKLSESDIDTICGLKGLKTLWIETDISDANIKKIEEALPECNVHISQIEEFEVADKESFEEIIANEAVPEGASVPVPDTEIEYQMVTIGGVEYPTNLTELDISSKNLTDNDIKELGEMKELKTLLLSSNNISDISVLEGLTNLEVLNLAENNISDISALKGLTKLRRLALAENNISDISALKGLTNLTFLNMGGNNPLNLQTNSISDISALSSLTNLKELYLGNNNISDISPLKGLTNLTWLYLGNNNISKNDIDELKKALPNCTVNY